MVGPTSGNRRLIPKGVLDPITPELVPEMGKVLKAEIRKPGIEYLTLAHDPEIQKKRLEMLKRAEELYMKIRGK